MNKELEFRPPKITFILFAIALFFLLLAAINGHAQEIGASFGYSRNCGRVMGLHGNNLKNKIGAYFNYYQYFYIKPGDNTFYDIDRSTFKKSKTIAHFYKGLTMGLSYNIYNITGRNGIYPVHFYIGAGNIDRLTITKKCTIFYITDNQTGQEIACSKIEYIEQNRKIFSPEIAFSAAAYKSRFFEAGLRLGYKYKTGASGSIYFSVSPANFK